MSSTDLKKLEEEAWKVIKKSSGALRVFTSNRKTHIIEIGTEIITVECRKQIAAREGYKSIEKFKIGLNERFGSEKPFNDIMGKFDKLVGPFVHKMYSKLQKEMKMEGSSYVIDFFPGENKDHYIIEIYLKGKKGGRGDVFQGFKDKFKSDAQRPLIAAINKWAMTKGGGRNWGNQHGSGTTGGGSGRTYSRRGQQFTEDDKNGMSAAELNRKIGQNTIYIVIIPKCHLWFFLLQKVS